jgi:uncharacterized damage-inducible protein DinB
MDALTLLRIQAHANRLANLRLHRAMAGLGRDDLHAARTSFFPTLMATLNHILAVDEYYVGALEGQVDGDQRWGRFVAASAMADLADRQREVDERLIAWLGAAAPQALDDIVALPRGQGRIQRDRAAHVLQHLFMHQTHHRGQVHAMLAGTAVPPPQLDEFLMPSEGHLRTTEMAALGWLESQVYGAPP